jgi:hypothetical protein
MTSTSKPRVIEGEFIHVASAEKSSPESHLNPLARIGGAVDLANPLGKRDALGEGMLQSVLNVREEDQAYLRRDRSLWARLTGKTSPRDQRIAQHDLAQCDTVCTFLEKKLALETDALYLRCQDDVNVWLARHRIASRGDLIDFATRELQGLKNTLEERRDEFTKYLRQRTQRLQRNADLELLVEAEVADMQAELQQHLTFLRELEELFRAAVKERIG